MTGLAATAPRLITPPVVGSLADRLLAVLHPPFISEVIVPAPGEAILSAQRCTVPGCDRRGQGRGLCGSHYSRWHKAGQPDLAEFTTMTGPLAAHRGLRAAECYDLRTLPFQLRLEIAYALQCRCDERGPGLRPHQVGRAVKLLLDTGMASLLDRPLAELLAAVQSAASRGYDAVAFVRYAHERVDDFARGVSVDDEYQRDTWDARRLGLPANASSYLIRFGGIPQVWLREAAKRWGRFRLATGKAIGTAAGDAVAMTWFARYLGDTTADAVDESSISRRVLEGYLSHLACADLAVQTRLGYLVALRNFLDTSRRHGWLPRLPADTALYPDDMPRRGAYLPRFTPEAVMAQLERADSLARIADPHHPALDHRVDGDWTAVQ